MDGDIGAAGASPALSGLGAAGSKRVRELRDWIEVPSVSGDEQSFTDLVARALAARGLDVERVEVGDGRATLLARGAEPRVVFCTHLDTVPPWFGSRVADGAVHGRGACDAKGVALAMLDAVERLCAEGDDRVGLLLTVGEEVDSDGARAADVALREGRLRLASGPEHVVVGEPTGNRFVRGHKGMLRAAVESRGVAGHSSDPRGPSAVHGLVRCCARMLDRDWGHHERLGPGSLNVGTLTGGVADNVVAAEARAELLLRSVRDPERDEAELRAALGPEERLTVHTAYPPVEFVVPDGESGEVVAFGTDAPYLGAWGRPLLVGPGSIELAHTAEERIGIAELEEGVERYTALGRQLLAQRG